MATHILGNDPVHGMHVSLRDQFVPVEPRLSLRRSRGFVEDHGALFVSTQAGLKGARAALTAIGFEALVVLGILTGWLFWHAS
jgi:hypothetical protein